MPHMSHKYSSVGKYRLKVFAAIYVVNIIVLALAAQVNEFQDFFFHADLFPLGLSIATLVLLSVMLILDFSLHDSFAAKPPFEISMLTLLSIFWLAFNIFSTSRWRYVPLACNAIPDDFSDEKAWCRNLQTLKAFVWVEWVMIFLTAVFTIRYVVRQLTEGNRHIWKTPLSRYVPYTDLSGDRASSVWGGRQFSTFGEYR